MRKKLYIEKPKIRAYLRHAFPNSIIPNAALKSGWIFDKYLQLEYHRENPWNRYINYPNYDFYRQEGVFFRKFSLLSTTNKKNIVEFIEELINKEYYVFGEWNEEKIKGKVAYKKFYFPHAFLLYGYDSAKKIFYSEGYTSDSWKWENYKISYDMFYDSIIFEIIDKNRVFWCDAFRRNYSYYYRFDFNKMKKEYDAYLYSKAVHRNKDVYYGIEGCHMFCEDIKSYVGKAKQIPRVSAYTLFEHKKIMYDRLSFLAGNKIIDDNVLEEYAILLERFKLVLNLVLKYNFTIERKTGEKVICILEKSLEHEYNILKRIRNRLLFYREGEYNV